MARQVTLQQPAMQQPAMQQGARPHGAPRQDTPRPGVMHRGRPWWREPWPWLLMSGPLLAMAGCGVTIWLAATHADPPVADATHHGLVVRMADAHGRDDGKARVAKREATPVQAAMPARTATREFSTVPAHATMPEQP